MEVGYSKMKLDQRVYLILTGIFIAVMTYVTITHYGSHAFMDDELYTLGFISKKNSFSDLMHIFFTDEVTNPPLYDIFLYFWYRIVPWGEGWLLFPNLVFVLAGLGAVSKLIINFTDNYRNVLFASILVFLNPSTYGYMLYYLRSYAMLFMFSAFSLYMYDKVREDESWKNIVLYGLVLLFMSLTHYFGVILTLAFGIYDAVLILIGNKKREVFLAYLVAGLNTGCYLLISLQHRTKNIASFWTSRPGLKDIWDVLCIFLINRYGVAIFAIAMAFTVYEVYKKYKKNEEIPAVIWTVVFTIAVVYIHGRWVNPHGSIFVHKYYLVLFPEVVVLLAYGLNNITEQIYVRGGKTYGKSIILNVLFIVVFSFLLLSRGVKHNLYNQFFSFPQNRIMTDYIKDCVDGTEKCVFAYRKSESQWVVPKYPVNGLIEYYLRNNENIIFVSTVDDAKDYDTIYLWYTMFAANIYNSETKNVDGCVLRELNGYKIKEVRDDIGLIVLQRDTAA